MAAEPEDEDDRWWAVYSKCRGMPPDYFFPVVRGTDGFPVTNEKGAEKPDLKGVIRAKRFCNGIGDMGDPCPVREECLHWAILHNQWEGVFGGMVERERRRYAKAKRAGIGFGGGVQAPTRPRQVGQSPPQ